MKNKILAVTISTLIFSAFAVFVVQAQDLGKCTNIPGWGLIYRDNVTKTYCDSVGGVFSVTSSGPSSDSSSGPSSGSSDKSSGPSSDGSAGPSSDKSAGPSSGSGPITLDNPFGKTGESLVSLLDAIFEKIIFPIGGILAVLAFIYSGFLFVKAQGNESELTTAKTALLYSAIGTAILLGARLIAEVIGNTVNQLK